MMYKLQHSYQIDSKVCKMKPFTGNAEEGQELTNRFPEKITRAMSENDSILPCGLKIQKIFQILYFHLYVMQKFFFLEYIYFNFMKIDQIGRKRNANT